MAAALPPSGMVTAAVVSSSSSPAPAPAAASSSHSGAAAASSSGGASSSDAYVRPPDPLPPLPVEVLIRCDSAHRVFLSTLLGGKYHPTFRWSRTGLPAACAWSNRVAHLLLLGADLNGGRVSLRFPVACGSCSGLEQLVHDEQAQYVRWEEHGDQPNDEWPLLLSDSLVTRWLSEYLQLHPHSTLQLTACARIGLRTIVETVLTELVVSGGEAAKREACGVVSAAHMQKAIRQDDELERVTHYLGLTQPGAMHSANAPASIRSDPQLLALSGEFLPNSARLQSLLSGAWFHNPQLVETYAQQYARLELPPGDAHFLRTHRIRPLAFFGDQLQTPPRRFNSRAVLTEEAETKLIERAAESAPKLCRVFAFELLDVDGVGFPIVCYLWPMDDGNEWVEAMLFHAAADGASFNRVGNVSVAAWQESYLTVTTPLSELPKRMRATVQPAAETDVAQSLADVTTDMPGACSSGRKRSRSDGSDAPGDAARSTAASVSSSCAPAVATAALVPFPCAPAGVTDSVNVHGNSVRSWSARGLDSAIVEEIRRLQTALRITQRRLQEQEQQQQQARGPDGPPHAPYTSDQAAGDAATVAKLAATIEQKRATFMDNLQRAELEHACMAAVSMANFRRYSLQLFPNFHPPAVRSHFTACLLDRASQAAGLPVLPLELLRLIGKYEPADLPYLPEQPLWDEGEVSQAAFVDQRVGGAVEGEE